MKNIVAIVLAVLLFATSALAQECGKDSATLCPGTDQDFDGYHTDGSGLGPDCDDTNWRVYADMPDVCDAGGGPGSGHRTCQASGTFTSCVAHTTSPFCEATNCFYVSPTGSDANPGTYTQPWATFAHAQATATAPNTAVYVFTGTYNESFTYPNSNYIFAAYPGQSPVIDLSAVSGPVAAIFAVVKNNIITYGFNIVGTQADSGIWLSEVEGFGIFNNTITGVDGVAVNNLQGIHILSSNSASAGPPLGRIQGNYLFDNYDTSNIGNPNNSNLTWFRSNNLLIAGNKSEYTPGTLPTPGVGIDGPYLIKAKHGSETSGAFIGTGNGSLATIDSNTLIGGSQAIGSGYAGMNIQNNLWLANGPETVFVQLKNLGGPAYQANNTVSFNTSVGGRFLGINSYDLDDVVINNIFSDNVIVDDSSAYSNESEFIVSNFYTNDTIYNDITDLADFDFQRNCYFNTLSVPLEFSWFEAISSGAGAPIGPTGPAGAGYSFAGWQAPDTTAPQNKPAWDDDSFVEDPLLDSFSIANSLNCDNKGYMFAAVIQVFVDVLTTTDTTPELTGSFTGGTPASTIDVTVDGNIYSATNNGDGTWTLADNIISPALAVGVYDVQATVTEGVDSANDTTLNELTIQSFTVTNWVGSFLRRQCRKSSWCKKRRRY